MYRIYIDSYSKAALDNNMMVSDMKRLLVEENPGHVVTFKVEER